MFFLFVNNVNILKKLKTTEMSNNDFCCLLNRELDYKMSIKFRVDGKDKSFAQL